MLLETGNVEVDLKDKYDQTPLLLAAERGHGAMVKLLLEMGKIDINSKDDSSYTPLTLAAARGHEAVVKLQRSI
jgi:ankyrin repeat domain-containing protein 50